MKEITFEEFGGPEVLRLTGAAVPEPGAGQVRVRVRAAGVNPVDFKIRRGFMEAVFPTVFPAVPGLEFSGVVDAVGAGVVDLAAGDEVLGWTAGGGAYAEYVLAAADLVTAKPAGLGWETAAALPVATETAQRVLDLLGVTAGETLVVHGAAGVVGSVAVQLAAGRGARVIGTAREPRHGWVRSLGAEPVRYGDGLEERVRELLPPGGTVDAVFDAAGHGALPALVALRGGVTDRVITIADPGAGELGVAFSAHGTASAKDLAGHAEAVAEGRLRVAVARSLPLGEAARAQTLSESGSAGGKLVLLP